MLNLMHLHPDETELPSVCVSYPQLGILALLAF
jgi:hypothetical protein